MLTTPVHGLASKVPWDFVLQEVGAVGFSGVLPQSVLCPLCRKGKLTAFHDNVWSGQWYYCDGCQFAGDTIQLYAKGFGVEIDQAINNLVAQLPELRRTQFGQDASVRQTYQKYNIDVYKYANAFWNVCSAKQPDGDLMRKLHVSTSISYGVRPEDWTMRGGRVVGGTTKAEVDKYVSQTLSVLKNRKLRPDSPVMVVPFWDLPGRLSGFLFATEGETELDVGPFFPLTHRYPAQRNRIPPSLAMLNAVKPEHDVVYAFADPMFALRLHVKALSQDPGHYRPLVGLWQPSTPSRLLLDVSPARPVVCFAERFTPEFFNHVKAFNGLVVREHERANEQITDRGVVWWLDMVRRHARPWVEVLEKHLDELSVAEAEAFIERLKWPRMELQEFVQGTPRALREKLKALVDRQFRYKSIEVDGKEILETERGWESPSGEVLSDCTFRIEQIAHNKHTNDTHYIGNVTWSGRTEPFTAPQDEFDSNPFKWLDNLLIERGVGTVTYSPKFAKMGVAVAKKIYKPEMIVGLGNYGWQEETQQFVLPKYAIKIDGSVVDHQFPTPRVGRLPAMILERPGYFTAEDLQLLGYQHAPDVECLWQVMMAVAYNLFAPVFNYKTVGTMLVGEKASALVNYAELMGCPLEAGVYFPASKHNDYVCEAEKTATWPVAFEAKIERNYTAYRWMTTFPHNCIIEINWYGSRAVGVVGGWHRIDTGDFRAKPGICQVAVKMIPLFLQHMMARRMKRYAHLETDYFKALYEDLVGWFTEGCKGSAFNITRAYNRTHRFSMEERATDFFDLVFHFYRNQLLLMKTSGTPRVTGTSSVPHVIDVPEADGMWIPAQGINQLLGKQHVFLNVLDVEAVSEALDKTGLLIAEPTIDGAPGWLIKKKTWTERYEAWTTSRRKEQQAV